MQNCAILKNWKLNCQTIHNKNAELLYIRETEKAVHGNYVDWDCYNEDRYG